MTEFTSLQIKAVLIDEASQLFGGKLAEIMIESRSAAHVLVGDSRQLPPHNADTVERLSGEKMLNSLDLVRQHRNTHHHQLRTSYRLFPRLCALISSVFYNGRLQSVPTRRESWAGKWPGVHDLLWVDVPEGKEETPEHSKSKHNVKEAETVAMLASAFLCDVTCDVAILTPYDAQRRQIEKLCLQQPGVAARYTETKATDGIETLQTVRPFVFNIDAFQGREADIIFVSLVRSTTVGGFLGQHSGAQRTNVLLSRAKVSMCIVGHFDTFASKRNSCTWWQGLCQQNGFHRMHTSEHPAFIRAPPDDVSSPVSNCTLAEAECTEGANSHSPTEPIADHEDDVQCQTPTPKEMKGALAKLQVTLMPWLLCI